MKCRVWRFSVNTWCYSSCKMHHDWFLTLIDPCFLCSRTSHTVWWNCSTCSTDLLHSHWRAEKMFWTKITSSLACGTFAPLYMYCSEYGRMIMFPTAFWYYGYQPNYACRVVMVLPSSIHSVQRNKWQQHSILCTTSRVKIVMGVEPYMQLNFHEMSFFVDVIRLLLLLLPCVRHQ